MISRLFRLLVLFGALDASGSLIARPNLSVGDPNHTDPVVVLILGDAHSNSLALELALRQAAAQVTTFSDGRSVVGPTHVIIDGDLTHSSGETLERNLKLIQQFTGLPREKIFATLGNREIRNGTPPEVSAIILNQYATPIPSINNESFIPTGERIPRRGKEVRKRIEKVVGFTSDIGRGVVDIGGHRILVSHFLQHRPPPEMMREIFFHALLRPLRVWNLRRIHSLKAWVNWEPTTRNMMAAANYPIGDYDLEIVGHWHKQFYYVDPSTGTLVMNPGSLASDLGNNPLDSNRFKGQPYGYSTYSFIPAEKGGILRNFDAQKKDPLLDILRVPVQHPQTCRVLVSHLPKYKRESSRTPVSQKIK